MAAAKDDFTYKGYGCPNTEMWTRRAAFEEAHPGLNTFMNKMHPILQMRKQELHTQNGKRKTFQLNTNNKNFNTMFLVL